MLDHMSGGRANAGFARGYQRRWVDVMAQQTHGIHGARPHQHDEIDAANRAAFEECYRIVKACWTEDFVRFSGRYWQVPPAGIPWDLDATAQWGGGADDGLVTAVAPVPKPVQKPHPPVFQPFASSERTIRFCAAEGITPILPALHPKTERRLVELYAEASGRPLGEGIGVLRDVVIAGDDDTAMAVWSGGPAFCGAAWFAPFGFGEGLLDPDTGEEPDLFGDSLALVGTASTVTSRLESLLARLPVQWMFVWLYNGLVSNADNLRSIEAWRNDVVPRVTSWE